MSKQNSLRLFLMDGILDGRIKCTIGYHSFIAYRVPRTMVSLPTDDTFLQNSGIYFLFGTTEDEEPNIYIGQANNRKNGNGLLCRIQEHLKEEWTEAILITTSDNVFGSTEVSYLENFFCTLARKTKRYVVRNGNEPNIGNPTEEMIADLKDVIDFTKLMVGVLGHKAFEPLTGKATKSNTLCMEYKKAKAKGILTSDGFVLLSGSTLNSEFTKTCPESTHRLRDVHSSKINKNNETIEDILFSSPSSAASFVAGASVNGNDCWKNSAGKTLKQIETKDREMTEKS